MPDWEDVREIVAELPEVSESTTRGNLFWRVRGKGFVWERPLGVKDRAELGAAAPEGPILGARTENLLVKDALIASEPEVYFTISHFDGYSAVLVRLDVIGRDELRELIIEAWLAKAPPRLGREYAAAHLPDDH
ncbi:MAG TPA: MmcQ/YjbR family DNA-binding protein [Solirubrobacteraceae bacterium]|nr:MmcQ/YjbR family DNA-binding protein [Solirubrobacteraceae bacterium]